MKTEITAKDFVAMAVIIAMVTFKLTGHNGSLDTALAIIIGYYFARREDAQLVIPPNLVNKGTHQELGTPLQVSDIKDIKIIK